jgi:hypothetical protein
MRKTTLTQLNFNFVIVEQTNGMNNVTEFCETLSAYQL